MISAVTRDLKTKLSAKCCVFDNVKRFCENVGSCEKKGKRYMWLWVGVQ